MFDWVELLITLGKLVLVLAFVLITMPYLTWFERKGLGRFQFRIGPNRTGPFGLLQPIADAVKALTKEDLIPGAADKWVFFIAPVFSFLSVMLVYSVIPFGDSVVVAGREITMYLMNADASVLILLALSSFGVYGIVMAGWSSNNKYALFGSLRSTAQVISYEVVMGLSLMGVIILSHSLNVFEMVKAQAEQGWFFLGWNALWQPIGFLAFLIAASAETNRPPFDLPEAESELVAGYHVEYSGMRFAMFMLSEYVGILSMSAVAATVFLGGFSGPILDGPWWVIAKMGLFIFMFYWLRATLPRFRYDQLMKFCWKILLPATLVNVLIAGALRATDNPYVFVIGQWVIVGLGLIIYLLKFKTTKQIEGEHVKVLKELDPRAYLRLRGQQPGKSGPRVQVVGGAVVAAAMSGPVPPSSKPARPVAGEDNPVVGD